MAACQQHCKHHPRNSGFALKWIIPVNKPRIFLPTKRARYSVALREMSLSGFHLVDDRCNFGHVVLSHDINVPTYLPQEGPVSAIKSFRIDDVRVERSFGGQEMEFFTIDFTSYNEVYVKVLDNDGRRINASGFLLLELYELS